jgi:hypothetical protein
MKNLYVPPEMAVSMGQGHRRLFFRRPLGGINSILNTVSLSDAAYTDVAGGYGVYYCYGAYYGYGFDFNNEVYDGDAEDMKLP